MNKEDILQAVTAVARDVFDNEHLVLTEQTTAKDIAEWDSLSHIQLVVAVEKRFRIRFGSREIQGWKNVGEMVNAIIAKFQ